MSESLSNFWKKSKMSKKKFVTRKKLPPYVLPKEIDSETETNIFYSIECFLVQTLADKFDKGYIDLDEEWQKADYDEILKNAIDSKQFDDEIIEEMKLDRDWIKDVREIYLKKYPNPFVGRYAYLFNMEIELKDEKDGTGEVVGQKKGIRGFKLIQSKYDKEIKFYIYGRIAIFSNKRLGYDEKWDKSEGTTTNEKGETEENKEEIQFAYCGIFATQNTAEKITEYVKYKLDTETEEKPFDKWECFLIGGRAGVKKKTDKDPANTPDLSFTMNADDVVFIG